MTRKDVPENQGCNSKVRSPEDDDMDQSEEEEPVTSSRALARWLAADATWSMSMVMALAASRVQPRTFLPYLS